MDRIERWATTLRAEWPFKLRLRAWPLVITLLFTLHGFWSRCGRHDAYDEGSICSVTTARARGESAANGMGQLLLEEGAWSTPARVEKIATERLGMRIPDVHDVEVIQP